MQVNFNPQRVGKYKLIGFEKDRLKTEDFRNDAVDAAERTAAADLPTEVVEVVRDDDGADARGGYRQGNRVWVVGHCGGVRQVFVL